MEKVATKYYIPKSPWHSLHRLAKAWNICIKYNLNRWYTEIWNPRTVSAKLSFFHTARLSTSWFIMVYWYFQMFRTQFKHCYINTSSLHARRHFCFLIVPLEGKHELRNSSPARSTSRSSVCPFIQVKFYGRRKSVTTRSYQFKLHSLESSWPIDVQRHC